MRTALSLIIYVLGLTVQAPSQEKFQRFLVSKDIEVAQLSSHAYLYTTYSEVPRYGRVASNGLIFIEKGESLLFNSPMDDSLTAHLIAWITDTLKVTIVGFVPNHWHADGLGGLNYINNAGIPTYACNKTIEIAKSKNLPIPQYGFSDSLVLRLGDQKAICKYFGPAHTADNIVIWIPSEKILFGGCMLKESKSESLGNTDDANLAQWPKTLTGVRTAYSSAEIVIPGHGAVGGTDIIQHTLDLLSKKK